MDINKKGAWIQGSISIPKPGPEIAVPLPAPAPMPMPPEACDSERTLVMSYVEKQQWTQTYEAETALERGTIFPELDLPFVGEGACRND